MVCDFCSSPEPSFQFRAHVIEIVFGAQYHAISSPYWTACEECKQLIEQNDRDGLALRSLAGLRVSSQGAELAKLSDEELLESLKQMQALFFICRIGRAERI